MMEERPTREQCWREFWEVIAREHADACQREADAEAASRVMTPTT